MYINMVYMYVCIYICISTSIYISCFLCHEGVFSFHCAPCFALFLSTMDSFGPTPVCVSDWNKKIPLCQVFWRYMIDRDTFVDMPQDLSDKYEKHYRENTLDFEYDIYDPEGTVICHYRVDLLNMTQEHTTSLTVRKLRREFVCNP